MSSAPCCFNENAQALASSDRSADQLHKSRLFRAAAIILCTGPTDSIITYSFIL